MLTPVAPGELAAIVTSLEMRARPRAKPFPPSQLRLVRWETPSAEKYRALFDRVGRRWLWFSRLLLDDAALTLQGHHLVGLQHLLTRSRREVKTRMHIAEMRFRAVTEPVDAPPA